MEELDKKQRKTSFDKNPKTIKDINKSKKRSTSKTINQKVKSNQYNHIRLKLALNGDDEKKTNKITKIKLYNNNKNNEKIEEVEYIEKGEIGHGAFGTCYIYESTKDWVQYAAKIVSKEKLKKDKNQQSIVNEINIQQSLNSPKVVKVNSIKLFIYLIKIKNKYL